MRLYLRCAFSRPRWIASFSVRQGVKTSQKPGTASSKAGRLFITGYRHLTWQERVTNWKRYLKIKLFAVSSLLQRLVANCFFIHQGWFAVVVNMTKRNNDLGLHKTIPNPVYTSTKFCKEILVLRIQFFHKFNKKISRRNKLLLLWDQTTTRKGK